MPKKSVERGREEGEGEGRREEKSEEEDKGRGSRRRWSEPVALILLRVQNYVTCTAEYV